MGCLRIALRVWAALCTFEAFLGISQGHISWNFTVVSYSAVFYANGVGPNAAN